MYVHSGFFFLIRRRMSGASDTAAVTSCCSAPPSPCTRDKDKKYPRVRITSFYYKSMFTVPCRTGFRVYVYAEIPTPREAAHTFDSQNQNSLPGCTLHRTFVAVSNVRRCSVFVIALARYAAYRGRR